MVFSFSLRLAVAILLALGLAACQTPATVIEKEYVRVNVPVPAPCPDDETYDAVMAARPTPLHEQERPATEDERIAAERRQLGRYEAPGGFADQAVAVIESCHNRPALDPPP